MPKDPCKCYTLGLIQMTEINVSRNPLKEEGEEGGEEEF